MRFPTGFGNPTQACQHLDPTVLQSTPAFFSWYFPCLPSRRHAGVLPARHRKRAVAQSGSALHWGCRGRGFESRQPDQLNINELDFLRPNLLSFLSASRRIVWRASSAIRTARSVPTPRLPHVGTFNHTAWTNFLRITSTPNLSHLTPAPSAGPRRRFWRCRVIRGRRRSRRRARETWRIAGCVGVCPRVR